MAAQLQFINNFYTVYNTFAGENQVKHAVYLYCLEKKMPVLFCNVSFVKKRSCFVATHVCNCLEFGVGELWGQKSGLGSTLRALKDLLSCPQRQEK